MSRTPRAEISAQLHGGFASQTRWLTGYLTGLAVAVLAVARLVF